MRKALLVTLIVLAVIGVAGWFGDNLLRNAAEDQAASALRSGLGLSSTPDVSIDGFPFALSLVTKSVPGARVGVASVPLAISGHDVRLTGVRVQTGRISLDGSRARVARADATGVLDYGSLAELTGVPVTYAGDGRLKLTYTARLAGQQVQVGVTALPVLDAKSGEIRLTKPELDTEAAPPMPVTAAQLAKLAVPIPVELPGKAKLTAVTAAEGGVAVGASVTDVSFAVG